MSEGARVVEFRRRGGWARALADGHLDRLRSRAQWARVRGTALRQEIDELVRQFSEDDLTVRSGPRRGEPLGAAGRRARLKRLAILHREYWQAADAEAHLQAILESLEMPGMDDEGEPPEAAEIDMEWASEEGERWVRSVLGLPGPAEREDD